MTLLRSRYMDFCLFAGWQVVAAFWLAFMYSNNAAGAPPAGTYSERVVEANCPIGYIDGIDAGSSSGNLCMHAVVGSAVPTYSQVAWGQGASLRDSVRVVGHATCDSSFTGVRIFRWTAGSITAYCYTPGLVGTQVANGATLTVDYTAYNVMQTQQLMLVLAQVAMMFLGIICGWKLALRPSIHLME